MNETKQKEKILSTEMNFEDIKTEKTIYDKIFGFFHKFKNKSELFIEYQLPSAQNNVKSWIKSFRGMLIIICLFIFTIIPLLLDRPLYYRTFILAMIYAIYAASWDLLAGVTGQVSFGHAAFFGLGGYGCAVFIKFLQFHWLFALILGAAVGVIFGLIIAIPSLRLKGPYLALGTLAFSLLLLQLFGMSSLESIFFGERGITNILTFLLIDYRDRFIFILIIMIISIVLMLAVSNSKLGMLFKAIRDDEVSTKASGINVVKYKIYAFMISSFFAGIAGGIYILDQTKVDPHIFSTLYSFYPVIMTCLGGITLISGSVFGAFFFVVLVQILDEIIGVLATPELNEIFANLPVFIFAIILLIIVRFTERGLMEPAIEKTKSMYELIIGK